MTLREHIRHTLRLAVPVMFSRAGLVLLITVDTAMTGHAGTLELAYYSLGTAPQLLMLLVGVGALLGTIVLTARAAGAGREQDCGPIWIAALVHAAVFGLLMAGLTAFGEGFLLRAGQSAQLASGGASVMWLLGTSMPAMLMFVATTLFLEGIDRPLPGVVIMVLANGFNALANWVLIYGHWGLAPMGADGAALATSLTRWLMLLAIGSYVVFGIDRTRYGITRLISYDRLVGRALRQLGYPMALTQGLESSAFAMMTLFAGWVSPVAVAAYQINISLISLVFMFALGFATAASVRVANAVGRRDILGLRKAGWTAVGLAVIVLGAFSVLYLRFQAPLLALYTDDAAVILAAGMALSVAAIVLIPDGFQAVLIAALRGMADVWPATALFFIAFWLVMLPSAYGFAVHANQGAEGLIKGMLLGCVAASVLLGLRFQRVTRPLP